MFQSEVPVQGIRKINSDFNVAGQKINAKLMGFSLSAVPIYLNSLYI